MKIALPISSFLPNAGGMEVGIHNLAKNLVNLGHEPIVITSYSIYKSLKKKKIKLPYKVIYFYPRMFYFFSLNKNLGMFLSEKYFKFLQRIYNFDFWHITMGFPLGVMFINYSLKNKVNNYILRCVGEDIQLDRNIGYGYSINTNNLKAIKKYLPHCKNLISISKSITDRYKDLGIASDAIHNITNGVSTERFKPLTKKKKNELRKGYGILDDEKVLITLGRNHPKKNYQFLIKLIKKMTIKKIKFKFLFVGQGVDKLKEDINSNDLSDRIILIDTSDNFDIDSGQYPSSKIIEYLLISDIFVFPSVLESFGVVIIEAMAAGLPLVANEVPGSRDLICNNKTGFLSKKINDTNTFIKKINLLIKNKKIAEQMKANSIRESKKYDWKKISLKYLNLYNKVIKENIK